MSACTWKHVSGFEAELMKRWYKQGKALAEIAELLDRDRTTVSGHVHTDGKDASPNPVGRPRKIQKKEWSKLEKALHALVSRAKAKKDVTVAMVITTASRREHGGFHAHPCPQSCRSRRWPLQGMIAARGLASRDQRAWQQRDRE